MNRSCKSKKDTRVSDRRAQRASYEVRFPDGRPSKYFDWEDIPGRRVRSDQADSKRALEDAKAFARAERDRGPRLPGER